MLYFQYFGKRGCELLVIDRETFKVKDTISLEGKACGSWVIFTDGENLGMIKAAKDVSYVSFLQISKPTQVKCRRETLSQDGFVVSSINPTSTPIVSVNELPLKLTRKCVDAFGTSIFDDEPGIHTILTGSDEETASIAAGKDFGLIRTNSGKVCGMM